MQVHSWTACASCDGRAGAELDGLRDPLAQPAQIGLGPARVPGQGGASVLYENLRLQAIFDFGFLELLGFRRNHAA